MKIFLITDTHAGARSDSDHLHLFFDKFYTEIFFPYLLEHNITFGIHLGDMFEKRKNIDFSTLHKTRKYLFDKLPEHNIKMDVIVGNHDSRFRDIISVNSPDLLLKDYIGSGHIRVYSTPTEVTIDGTNILYMPWICPDTYDLSTELLKTSDCNILLGHLEISGFEMHRGSIHHGGISSSMFSNFGVVYSGHFHHRSTKGNVTYLGTPYETCWADYNDPKGFHIFDTDTLELIFVENPYKLFHKIVYDDSEWSEYPDDNLDFSYLKNTYIKLLVDNKTNSGWFDRFVSNIEQASPIDLQIIEDTLNMVSSDDEINVTEDTISILNKSVMEFDTKVNKTKLNNLFSSLYTESMYME